MNLDEAKAQVAKEWEERHEEWRREAQERIDAGEAQQLDLLFASPLYNPNWFERVWWPVRRFVRDKLWHRYLYSDAKNFVQRGKRGWGHQDWWNASNYLEDIIAPMMREFAKHHHGIPFEIVDWDGSALYSHKGDDETDDDFEKGCAVWIEVLNRIADGMEASAYLHEQGWRHESEAELELVRMKDEAMQLLIRNWDGLWD